MINFFSFFLYNKMGTGQSKFPKRYHSFRRKKQSSNENFIVQNLSKQEPVSSIPKFPSVNEHIDYLHQHHFLVKSIWSSNFSSPIEDILNDGAKVLDVRCGAGTFLLELSNEYPFSEFTGIDKTKLFPSLIKPSNLNFIHANILEGLPFQQNHFDFVYLNIVEPRYTKEQWAFIISELIRVAKLGGYIEVQGFDSFAGTIGPKFLQFIQKFAMIFSANGVGMGSRNHIKSILSTNSYFYSDQKEIYIGKNGGESGVLLEDHTTMFFVDIIGEAIAELNNITMDELKRDWKEVQKEFEEIKTSLEIFRMWVMKS
ncbi:S-adenosyl-L-methionine-dependent methyltransferase [Rhizophagus diaphanus]|nr:S-adenosyl-L-methionine-dependent methyltransferase [Rhizophagus diaphanus] [Rhizophagus sp. MUCL 43196]